MSIISYVPFWLNWYNFSLSPPGELPLAGRFCVCLSSCFKFCKKWHEFTGIKSCWVQNLCKLYILRHIASFEIGYIKNNHVFRSLELFLFGRFVVLREPRAPAIIARVKVQLSPTFEGGISRSFTRIIGLYYRLASWAYTFLHFTG